MPSFNASDRREVERALIDLTRSKGGQLRGSQLRALYRRHPGASDIIHSCGGLRMFCQDSRELTFASNSRDGLVTLNKAARPADKAELRALKQQLAASEAKAQAAQAARAVAEAATAREAKLQAAAARLAERAAKIDKEAAADKLVEAEARGAGLQIGAKLRIQVKGQATDVVVQEYRGCRVVIKDPAANSLHWLGKDIADAAAIVRADRAAEDAKKLATTKSAATTAVVVWEAEVDGQWISFPEDNTEQIETAYVARQAGTAGAGAGGGAAGAGGDGVGGAGALPHVFKRAQHSYAVDWLSSPMAQVNARTGVRRPIRRRQVVAAQHNDLALLSPRPTTPVETLRPFGSNVRKYTLTHNGAAGIRGQFEERHFGIACAQFFQMMLGAPAAVPAAAGPAGRLAAARRSTAASRRQFKISSVDFYDNPALTKRFEAARQGLPTGTRTEEWVFHGMSAATAQNIMLEGFLVGGVDTSSITGQRIPIKTGAAYGQGVYAARGPDAPVGYADSPCIILAKALLGNHAPECAKGGGVDSWSPPGHDGDWVIFSRKELLLPCYVVHYV